MVTIGVDLHKRISQIAVLTPEGEVVSIGLDNDPEKMEQFFTKIPSPAPVAIEACATRWWLVDILERLGHRARTRPIVAGEIVQPSRPRSTASFRSPQRG